MRFVLNFHSILQSHILTLQPDNSFTELGRRGTFPPTMCRYADPFLEDVTNARGFQRDFDLGQTWMRNGKVSYIGCMPFIKSLERTQIVDLVGLYEFRHVAKSPTL